MKLCQPGTPSWYGWRERAIFTSSSKSWEKSGGRRTVWPRATNIGKSTSGRNTSALVVVVLLSGIKCFFSFVKYQKLNVYPPLFICQPKRVASASLSLNRTFSLSSSTLWNEEKHRKSTIRVGNGRRRLRRGHRNGRRHDTQRIGGTSAADLAPAARRRRRCLHALVHVRFRIAHLRTPVTARHCKFTQIYFCWKAIWMIDLWPMRSTSDEILRPDTSLRLNVGAYFYVRVTRP